MKRSSPFEYRILNYLLIGLIILIPASYPLYLALNSGEVSSNDYWSIIWPIYTVDGFSVNLSDWLVSQNGHIVFIPKIIYALNIIFTQGSNIYLSLTAWLLALLQTLLLIRLLPRSLKDWPIFAFLVFTIAAFSFPAGAVHSWTLGFSGVHWIAANLFAVASIACLTRYYRIDKKAWVSGSLFFAVAATFTYGTALTLWLALCAGTLILITRLRLGLLFIGTTIIVYIFYLSGYGENVPGYETQAEQSVPIFDRLTTLFVYATTYLGAIFTTNLTAASVLGTIGLLLSGLLLINVSLRSTNETRLYLYPWHLIQIYVAINGLVTGLSRSHFGILQATASRYASLPGLFWLSLTVILMYYLRYANSQWSWRKFAPAFVSVGVLILAMYPVGFARQKGLRHKILLQPLALQSIDLNIPDDAAIRRSITTAPPDFLAITPTLRVKKHIPYHKPIHSCGEIDQKIPQEFLIDSPPKFVNGYFDFMDRFTERGARVVGWVHSENHDVNCITLLNQENIIQGIAFKGFYRPDVAETLNIPNDKTGWMGYARVSSDDETLTAYVQLAGSKHWIALGSSHSPNTPGKIDPTIFSGMILTPPCTRQFATIFPCL